MNNKYHYTYIITNTVNGKQYVGDHSTNNLNDNYMGSGVLLNEDKRIFNKDSFKKDILEHFDNKYDAYLAQKKYIIKFKTHITQGGYNKNWTGGQWATIVSEKTKQLISDAVSGEKNGMFGRTHSTGSIEQMKISSSGKPSGMTGKTHTTETKEKLSNHFIGISIDENTKKKISNTLTGRVFSEDHKNKLKKSAKKRKPISDETRKKMSEARKGKSPSNKGKKKIINKYD